MAAYRCHLPWPDTGCGTPGFRLYFPRLDKAEGPLLLAQQLPLCVTHNSGYRSSQGTPSKTLGKQDSLLPPPSLRILLTPPSHEVGVQP